MGFFVAASLIDDPITQQSLSTKNNRSCTELFSRTSNLTFGVLENFDATVKKFFLSLCFLVPISILMSIFCDNFSRYKLRNSSLG